MTGMYVRDSSEVVMKSLGRSYRIQFLLVGLIQRIPRKLVNIITWKAYSYMGHSFGVQGVTLCYRRILRYATQITSFMGPTGGPPGSYRPQVGPILAPWTLLFGYVSACLSYKNVCVSVRFCIIQHAAQENKILVTSIAVHPTNYAHDSCFMSLYCGFVLVVLPIIFSVTSLPPGQSQDSPQCRCRNSDIKRVNTAYKSTEDS